MASEQSTRIFRIEVRDYEQGEEPAILTTSKIEDATQNLIDSEGADGIVIVTEE